MDEQQEAPPACEGRHVDPSTGEMIPATTRVYWLEPGADPEDPALAEAELCDRCRDEVIEPWAKMGALEWVSS